MLKTTRIQIKALTLQNIIKQNSSKHGKKHRRN